MSEKAALAFARSLESIWSLELLIILKNNPEKCWLADELERELRGSALVVREGLDVLARLGLAAAASSRQWRYTPASAVLDNIAGDLVQLYATKRISVINAIHASATDRMRSFASAFKIKDNEP